MPKNDVLIKSITELDHEFDAGEMTNAQLVAKLQELKDAAKPKGPTVAKGKAVTSKRGILGEGETIAAKDLAGGEEAFAALVKAGYIVE